MPRRPIHQPKRHQPERDRGTTVEQLRRDIDRGVTHDKVPGSDPAAAPLGADEEAAGTPPPSGAVATDREWQLRAHAGRPSAPAHSSASRYVGWIWLALPIAAIILVGLFLWLRPS